MIACHPECVFVDVCVPGQTGSKGRWGRVALGNKGSKRAAKGEGGCTSQRR